MWEQLKQLMQTHRKIEIHLMKLAWNPEEWSCSLSLEDDGLSLKAITNQAQSPEEAVDQVYEKFMCLVEKGAPQLLKVIIHQPTVHDEEIPF